MKKRSEQILFSFVKQFVFWLLVFDLSRLVFILYNLQYLRGVPLISLSGVFWFSLPLDISATTYIMVLPFIILLAENFYTAKWVDIIQKVYVFMVLFLVCIITSVEAGIYSEWKTKLHYKALLYLTHPGEIAGTAQTWQIILISALIFIQTGLCYFVYVKFVFRKIMGSKSSTLFFILFLIFSPSLLFLGMRGGSGIPINQSQSYYSKHEILNWISVNSLWNLGSSILRNIDLMDKSPFAYYDDAGACQTVSDLFKYDHDSTEMILNTGKPNIVMFILEGWSADLIESQGGKKGITPFFHEMEKNGILFTNIYTNGTRSQEGMTAIFSGFPAQGITTISQQPEKYDKLPSLIQKLQTTGYFSSFFFGGQLIYGNIRSYLTYIGFDKIIEDKDFPAEYPRGKLGIHDEYTLPYFLKALGGQPQPFFSSIFTLSTHSPYDFKMQEKFFWPQYEKKYTNAAFYADQCLKGFFTEAKRQPWYRNTLFLLVSDHSHGSYRNHHFCSPDYHKIVMLFYGDVIKNELRGTQNTKVGSQTDLPAIISAQLGLDYCDFHWSKNLMQPHCPEFAFFAYEGGFGLVRPGGYLTFDTQNNCNCMVKIDSASEWTEEELARQAKSYMQCSFKQYIDF